MLVWAILALLAGCTGKDTDSGEDEPWRPELVCPGDAGCESGDGQLMAGAAAISIAPACWEEWTDANGNYAYAASDGDTWEDCGCDRLCPSDAGYPGADEGEGDGVFQAVWIAGFQNARAMSGVRGDDLGLIDGDDVLASAAVFRQGDVTLAFVSLDGFGWMNDQVLQMREQLASEGIDVDHLVVNSSHSHATPDSLGIYGRTINTSGFDPAYAEQVRQGVIDAVRQAAGDLHPVRMRVGAIDLSTVDSDKGVGNWVWDTRDPFVLDPMLSAASFQDTGTGDTVVTLVHWANHVEASADDHTLVSSDFAHGIRTAVTDGTSWSSGGTPGLGGVCLYVQGTVGGLMTPLRVEHVDPDGVGRRDHSFEKADAIGLHIGELAVQALEDGEVVDSPDLSFRMHTFYFPIENVGFQAMFLLGVLDRPTFNWDDSQPVSADNTPEILTEVDIIDIGPVQMLTVPGELFPELAFGGYDGSLVNVPGQPLIDPDNPNPPDVANAPQGPYFVDHMGGTYNWVVGLGNDEVGYIIPEYDFVLNDTAPYISEAEGDHYEETNSLGPRTAGILAEEVERIAGWTAP